MAGPRYPNYFPKDRNDTGFNSTKYILYFCYLKAKEFISAKQAHWPKNSENTELHENRDINNSRSRAGAICQTRLADLVVSALGVGILLSSVLRVLDMTLFYTVLAVFVCLSIFTVKA